MEPWLKVPVISSDVHYVSQGSPMLPDGTQKYESACIAAKVTQVSPDVPGLAGLFVMNPAGTFHHPIQMGGSQQDEKGHAPGSWHWPEES